MSLLNGHGDASVPSGAGAPVHHPPPSLRDPCHAPGRVWLGLGEKLLQRLQLSPPRQHSLGSEKSPEEAGKCLLASTRPWLSLAIGWARLPGAGCRERPGEAVTVTPKLLGLRQSLARPQGRSPGMQSQACLQTRWSVGGRAGARHRLPRGTEALSHGKQCRCDRWLARTLAAKMPNSQAWQRKIGVQHEARGFIWKSPQTLCLLFLLVWRVCRVLRKTAPIPRWEGEGMQYVLEQLGAFMASMFTFTVQAELDFMVRASRLRAAAALRQRKLPASATLCRAVLCSGRTHQRRLSPGRLEAATFP